MRSQLVEVAQDILAHSKCRYDSACIWDDETGFRFVFRSGEPPKFEVGSTFTFEVPLERKDAVKRDDLSVSYTERALKALIVDDNPVNVVILQHILETKAVSVSTATNGKEALEQVGKDGFDVVLMDLQMPVMDGYEAIRRIREMGSIVQPRIVVVTAFIDDENRARARARARAIGSGADGFITKPVNRDELFQALYEQNATSDGNFKPHLPGISKIS